MRTFIVTISFLLCLLIFTDGAKSQNYISFPDSGIIWRQTSIRFNPATTTQICYDNQFELTGEDTIINSISYIKLYLSGLAGANGVCDLSSIANQNNWAIREDTTKRVYIFDYISGQEFLLYDFNLGLGDTLAYGNAFSFNGSYDNYVEVITSIDSLLIDGLFHKVYHITSTNWMGVVVDYVQIIEGIGSTFGLFADNSPNWGEKYDLLNCVYINGQVVYFQTQPCSLLTAIENVDTNGMINTTFNIYPNPASDNLTISCPNGTLTIKSTEGKSNYTQVISNNRLEINLTEWRAGVYFMSLITKDQILVRKLVVK